MFSEITVDDPNSSSRSSMEYDTHSLKDGLKGYVLLYHSLEKARIQALLLGDREPVVFYNHPHQQGQTGSPKKEGLDIYMRMSIKNNKQNMVHVIERKGDINERVSESV